jgi:hypothetical protein
MELISLTAESRSPQLVPQFAVSQQSAMPLVRNPQFFQRAPFRAYIKQ